MMVITPVIGVMMLSTTVQAAQGSRDCTKICTMGCKGIYGKKISSQRCQVTGTTFNPSIDENGVINARCTCSNGMVENIRVTFTHFNTDNRKNH